MYNANVPSKMEVPSTAQLIKSTVIAAATASVLLVTVVMPAEYGVDPTGIGDVLQLTEQGRIKTTLAKEAAAEKADQEDALRLVAEAPAMPVEAQPVEPKATAPQAEPDAPVPTAPRTDEMKLTLAPDQGTEIKVTMQKGQKVNYTWFTSGGALNYDVHADSTALNIKYHGYEKGKMTERKEGEIVAAFDGNHGWFWRNRTSAPVTLTLQTNGQYSAIKEMK